MSARSILALVLVASVLAGVLTPFTHGYSNPILAPSETVKHTVLNNALNWLARNQSSDGSYGAFFDHYTAAAAYAFWLNDTSSTRASHAYSWLAKTIDNSTYWYWKYTEADVPGAVLYSIGASGNIPLIRLADVRASFLQLHQPDGGFIGYAAPPTYSSVSSSVDTSEVLLGLSAAQAINSTIHDSSVDYLLTLQNSDGSFNLTRTQSYDTLYSQGPEPFSVTALVLLALKVASVDSSNAHVVKALDYLATASHKNFNSTVDNKFHVYAASLSVLAFNSYGRFDDSSRTSSFIVSQQDSAGGFHDNTRSSSGSNGFDTAWAAIALQQQTNARIEPAAPLLGGYLLGVVAGVAGVAVLAGFMIYFFRKRPGPVQTLSKA